MRVDIEGGNTFFESFILNKGLKLGKRPTMNDIPLFSGKPYPFSDILKVFKNKHIAIAGIVHDLPANMVVYVGHPAFFFSTEPFQELFCPFCAFSLKRRSGLNILLSFMYYLLTGEFKSAGRICDIVNSPVYTYNVAVWNNILNYVINGYMYKKAFMLFAIDYLSGRWRFAVKHIPLIIADVDMNVFKPSVYRTYGYFHVFERKRPCVKVERMSAERFRSFTCGHSRYRSDDEVCGKAVSAFNIMVAKLLNPEFIFTSIFGGYFKNIVARVVKSGESVFDGIKLFIVENKLAFNGLSKFFHSVIISKILINLNINMEANCSSPLLKQGASAI